MSLNAINGLPLLLSAALRQPESSVDPLDRARVQEAVDALLDLSTRGRPGIHSGQAKGPLGHEEALAVATQLGQLIEAGVIGWEWHRDAVGAAKRVFAEEAVFGYKKGEKPVRPGETP